MAQVLRRIASIKINRGVSSNRLKEHENWKNSILNKERDKLLQEFLLAREELKAQFDLEKREIVGNYERRIRYLRRLLEECDENINMLKLNLDAEKEENFILKTKVMELEGRICKYNAVGNKTAVGDTGYFNQSYDNESTFSCSCRHAKNNNLNVHMKLQERSSLDGLKYSDRIASCGSIGQDSCFTNISSLQSMNPDFNDNDIHQNCRKEFNRLLEELRQQQDKFDIQLQEEKENMKEQIENEKLQLERVVYKQLNTRLEREVKKQELLFTENAHLRRTISNTIIETLTLNKQRNNNKKSSLKKIWKETNSDSGADVEDNRSDDDSDMSDSGKSSLTMSDRTLNRCLSTSNHDIINTTIISKMIEDPLNIYTSISFNKNEEIKGNLKSTINGINTEIVAMVTENCVLKGPSSTVDNLCFSDITNFHEELRTKLEALEEMLGKQTIEDIEKGCMDC